jgi:hypothetical protein
MTFLCSPCTADDSDSCLEAKYPCSGYPCKGPCHRCFESFGSDLRLLSKAIAGLSQDVDNTVVSRQRGEGDFTISLPAEWIQLPIPTVAGSS